MAREGATAQASGGFGASPSALKTRYSRFERMQRQFRGEAKIQRFITA
jgi:hypothetical protein